MPPGIQRQSMFFKKIAAHPFAVGFKGKHEGGDSYSRAGQQGHLYGLEGVRTTDEYKQNSQQRSVERFYKKEGGGALEIVYTAAALRNHCGHGGKIVIEKDELGYAAGCGGAVAHGYGAIGCAQGGDIVYTVAHEGHGVPLRAELLHQKLLLKRGNARKKPIFCRGGVELLRVAAGAVKGGAGYAALRGNAFHGGGRCRR